MSGNSGKRRRVSARASSKKKVAPRKAWKLPKLTNLPRRAVVAIVGVALVALGAIILSVLPVSRDDAMAIGVGAFLIVLMIRAMLPSSQGSTRT